MNSVIKKHGHFKSFDGTKIYYETRGEGVPIIFCYGIGCQIHNWRFQSRHFSEEHTAVVWDYRAHYKSEKPKQIENMSIEAIAKDLEILVKHLGYKKAHFVGHSFGGQVLFKAFELAPEIFQSISLINCFAEDPVSNMFGNGSVSKIFKLAKKTNQMAPETLKLLWKAAVDNPLSGQVAGLLGGFNLRLIQLSDIEVYLRGTASLDLGCYLTLFENMMNYNATKILQTIKCPTLIISGTKDAITPPEYQLSMHKAIQGSELVEFPYGSHATQLDMPNLVNVSLEKFLNKKRKTTKKKASKKASKKTSKKAGTKKASKKKTAIKKKASRKTTLKK